MFFCNRASCMSGIPLSQGQGKFLGGGNMFADYFRADSVTVRHAWD